MRASWLGALSPAAPPAVMPDVRAAEGVPGSGHLEPGLDDLQRGTSVKAIRYMWTNNNTFGATWTTLQLLVVNPPPQLTSLH